MATSSLLSVTEQLSSSLNETLNLGYGPSFQHSLVSTSTGKVLITNSGVQILKALNVEHPIVRLIVQSVSDHQKTTGDDSKTFVLLLTELLRKTYHLVQSNSETSNSALETQIRIGQDFSSIITDVLPTLFKTMEKFCNKAKLEQKTAFSSCISEIISGLTGSHLLENDSSRLTKVLVTFLSHWFTLNKGISFIDAINYLIDNQNVIFVECPGKPVTSSYVLPGYLVSRMFCNYDLPYLSSADGQPIKFILMTCSMESLDDDGSDIKAHLHLPDTNHQETMSKIIEYKRVRTDTFLQHLQQLGVTLIFTTTVLSTLEKTQCSRHGITAVHSIPDEELYFLSTNMNVKLISCTHDIISTQCIGAAESCEQIVLGSQTYVHMKNTSSVLADEACCFVTCGPTEGISHQVHQLLGNVLKAVRMALIPSNCYFEKYRAPSMENLSLSGSLQKSSRMSDGGDSGICVTPNDLVSRDRPAAIGDSSLASPLVHKKSQPSNSADEQVCIQTIPVGGSFELALHHVISNYLSTQAAGAPGTTALAILKEALLIVPRQLHTNAYYIAKPRWLTTLDTLSDSIKHGRIAGVDASDGSATTSSRHMHPFNSKCQMISNVLYTLNQLLRIDKVL